MMKNLMGYIKTRVSNYGFWVSLFALVPLAVQCLGDASILPGNYEEIINLVLMLLVALGITNDPTTRKKWYLDDK